MRNLREGRYHTLLTSTLTHYNLTHLGLNMFALWGFGQTVVAFYGVPTFAILWVGSGIAGGLLQSYFWVKNPNPYVETKAMGASGSILGIFAALTCVMPMATVTLVIIPMPMFVAAAATIGLSVGALKEGWMPYVGHADHLGGMAFGAFWWLVAMRRGSIRHLRRMR
jgi:membrane associated rhomboid family serine protease